MSDFDKDLEHVEEIRATVRLAASTTDVVFLLSFIDKLWNEYTRTLQQLDGQCAKLVADTGGGCSVCGATPCVNVTGAYWLCGPCVLEYQGAPK